MDPFGPVKNEEGGRSKRRTSILKVPRKSILLSEVEQQDDMVEYAKPSDKRISRRVSFAPDLPLYAKDIKNTSSTQSPLQELASASDVTQNGIQIKVTEDQQFTGMDIALNTPKQVWAKANVSEGNFGEKTIMFNANDLEMTQCHITKITNEEVFNTSRGFLHGQGEKTILFDRSMDMTLSQTLNMTCDQDISFLSKPTSQTAFPFTTTMTHGTEFFSFVNNDKENLVPKLNTSLTKKKGDPNLILGGSEDDFGVSKANPFQCLFPQEIYAESGTRTNNCKDNHVLIENASKKLVNFDTKDDDRSEKTIMFSDDGFMDMTQNWTGNIVVAPSVSSTQNKCLKERKSISAGLSVRLPEAQERTQLQDARLKRVSSCQGLKTSLKTNTHQKMADFDEGNEKTVRFSIDDACMDETRSHTVKISSEHQLLPDLSCLPMNGEKTVRFTANEAGMDITQCQTVNIAEDVVPDSPALQKQVSSDGARNAHSVDLDFENFFASLSNQCAKVSTSPDKSNQLFMNYQNKTVSKNSRRSILGTHANKEIEMSRKSEKPKHLCNFDAEERTVQFAADGALMDVTSSHTVHISTDLKPELPFSEKTVRFDAEMDTTQCHTVKITKDFDPSINEDLGVLPNYGEKFDNSGVNNNTKYDTQSCVSLKESSLQKCANDHPFQQQGNGTIFPMSGEKTLRFNIDDASIDAPKSHAMRLPRSEDKTVCFSSDDGGMEVTQCLTSNIGFETEATQADLSSLPSNVTMDCPVLKKKEPATYTNRRCRSLSAHGLSAAFKVRRSTPWGNQPMTTSFVAVNSNKNAAPSHLASNGDLNNEDATVNAKAGVGNENIGFLSVIEEKSIAEISQKEERKENGDTNLTEVLPVQMLKQAVPEEHDQELMVKESELMPSAEERDNKEEVVAMFDVETEVQPNSPPVNDERDVEERIECSPPIMERDTEVVLAENSRQRSLANIQSKLRRISQMLNAPPDTVMDGNNLTSSLDPDSKVDREEIRPGPEDEPNANVDTDKVECKPDDTQEEPFLAPTTPFRLETGQLLSRLSVAGFKPKLPRRSKNEEGKTPDVSLKQTAGKSPNTQNPVGNFDLNVSDINDEELGSYEDVSETLGNNSMDKEAETMTPFCEFELDEELKDDIFEEDFAVTNGRKRPSDEQNKKEDKKRMKICSENMMLDAQTGALEDENMAAKNTQMADSSSCSQSASVRCEATFDSTSKQSLSESQLEDYASDMQRKFDEGTITMAEFFKLFHIDFVIHNPRQSVVPGRALSDAESTMLDLCHDRHISLPKQLVYEANVHSLSKQVEGFKVRMRDLDKPLTTVNRALWEEMKQFLESEFKSFGDKLKERHGVYRKMSKAQSHEMKETLYSDLIQANVEEQKKLSESIERADDMLKNLNDGIVELEADLATIENDVKSHQEELNKVTNDQTGNEKSTAEMEILKKQNINKVRKVKEETKKLEEHLDVVHMLNEWKLVEIRVNTVIYSFLHDTLHLLLDYEESEDNAEERKIVDISFKHKLDEKSHCHAQLVHSLISQFTQEKSLTAKYSTSKHVPQLLHDVSLVVNRCREFGEELRRLKAWGSLRFDILDIHCLRSEVYVVFSSLKRFTKFEIVIAVALKNQLCTVELKSFKNIIGNTTIQHIGEIVASATPGQKYLTRIIKNIHTSLLC